LVSFKEQLGGGCVDVLLAVIVIAQLQTDSKFCPDMTGSQFSGREKKKI